MSSSASHPLAETKYIKCLRKTNYRLPQKRLIDSRLDFFFTFLFACERLMVFRVTEHVIVDTFRSISAANYEDRAQRNCSTINKVGSCFYDQHNNDNNCSRVQLFSPNIFYILLDLFNIELWLIFPTTHLKI